MGGDMSKSNDSMVDGLVRRNLIIDKSVELAFRLTDRARFLPAENLNDAYRETPIKILSQEDGKFRPGPLHLSSPAIYARVVTQLDIRAGMSVLNIGSGTGYLSTIIGFLLGDSGTNIGIDIYKNLVEYAEENSLSTVDLGQVHAFGWCRPKYFCCNGLSTDFLNTPDEIYDRIYCGAALNDQRKINKLIRKLKINGFLIVPVHPSLFKFTRTATNKCLKSRICESSFADLVDPKLLYAAPEIPPPFSVPSLRELCRAEIRAQIRRCIPINERPSMQLLISNEKENENGNGLRPTTRNNGLILLSTLSNEDKLAAIAMLLLREGDPLTTTAPSDLEMESDNGMADRFRRAMQVVRSENLMIPEGASREREEGRSDGQPSSSRDVPFEGSSNNGVAEDREIRMFDERVRSYVRRMIDEPEYLNEILSKCYITFFEYRIITNFKYNNILQGGGANAYFGEMPPEEYITRPMRRNHLLTIIGGGVRGVYDRILINERDQQLQQTQNPIRNSPPPAGGEEGSMEITVDEFNRNVRRTNQIELNGNNVYVSRDLFEDEDEEDDDFMSNHIHSDEGLSSGASTPPVHRNEPLAASAAGSSAVVGSVPIEIPFESSFEITGTDGQEYPEVALSLRERIENVVRNPPQENSANPPNFNATYELDIGINFPETVFDHPLMRIREEWAELSNDSFSFVPREPLPCCCEKKRKRKIAKKRELASKRRKLEQDSLFSYAAFFESTVSSLPLSQNLKDYLLKLQHFCY